jgi:hypothetical protein
MIKINGFAIQKILFHLLCLLFYSSSLHDATELPTFNILDVALLLACLYGLPRFGCKTNHGPDISIEPKLRTKLFQFSMTSVFWNILYMRGFKEECNFI